MAGYRSYAFRWFTGYAVPSGGPSPELCECPPWITKQEAVCGWEESPTLGYTSTGPGSAKEFPFTIPLFRLYDLAQPAGSGENTYDCGYTDSSTLSDTAVRDNSFTDTSVTPMTLPRLFTRKGCG